MERISSNSTPSAIPSWRIVLCCGSGVVAFGLAGFGLHSKGAEIREEVYAEKPQTAQETSWLRTIRSELWEKKVVIANRSFFCQARQKREEPAIPRRLVCLIGFV